MIQSRSAARRAWDLVHLKKDLFSTDSLSIFTCAQYNPGSAGRAARRNLSWLFVQRSSWIWTRWIYEKMWSKQSYVYFAICASRSIVVQCFLSTLIEIIHEAQDIKIKSICLMTTSGRRAATRETRVKSQTPGAASVCKYTWEEREENHRSKKEV